MTPSAELPPPPQPEPAATAPGVHHYENFPVASWLCPPHLRPAIQAIYHFARTADDMADEGDAVAAARLADIHAYRLALEAWLNGTPDASGHWHTIFKPLVRAVQEHDLSTDHLHDLLSAFEQDVRHTASGHRYASTQELLNYCKLSANPVGRLLLQLYTIDDRVSLRQSDQICSALQLINFWQDIRTDHKRHRHYLPSDMLRRHGIHLSDFAANANPEVATRVRMAKAVADLCDQARLMLLQGAPLALRIPGRAGWELRLVVLGGLRILEKMKKMQYKSWEKRPRLNVLDAPLLLWRALWMPWTPSALKPSAP